MADTLNQPTLNVDFLKPEAHEFDILGSGIDGGRNGSGDAPSIELSGGGRLVASYDNCFVQSQESYEYLYMLGSRLNGSFRNINAVLITDWSSLFPVNGQGVPEPFITGIPHSDGSYFSDGSGYSQATVFGTVASSAALNAGQIQINIYGNQRDLRWSDWFSIYHVTKGWRAYRFWECSDPIDVTETIDDVEYTGQQYTIAITPPLREATAAGTLIEFARPRFVAKFPMGFTLPVRAKGFWQSSPSIKLVEAY